MRLIEEKYVSEDGKRRIRIEHDQDAESPRNWDNLGTMVCWHGRYDLGDEQPKCSPSDFQLGLAEEYSPGIEDRIESFADRTISKYSSPMSDYEWQEYGKEIREYHDEIVSKVLEKHYIMLPLHLYDHSGITMNTSGFSCGWDSGCVGFIYVSKDKVRKEFGWKRITTSRMAQVEKCLRCEVETYDKLISGEVYGFIAERLMPCPEDWDIEEWAEHDAHWDEEDSCWGFFGMDIIENGILDHLDDEFTQVFCEAEGITLDQLKKEQQEWVDKVMA